jgi:hypothetical protein
MVVAVKRDNDQTSCLSARQRCGFGFTASPKNRPKVKASFGNTHTHRAREACFIRTSERLQKRSAGETPTGSRHTSGSNTPMLPLGEMATARLGRTESRLTEFTACFRENVRAWCPLSQLKKDWWPVPEETGGSASDQTPAR